MDIVFAGRYDSPSPSIGRRLALMAIQSTYYLKNLINQKIRVRNADSRIQVASGK